MTNVNIVRAAQSEFLQAGRPDIRTGMEVEVYQKIKEGSKERIQRFKGIVIKTAGKSELEKTITVRRKVGAFGVEKIFAVHSSSIEKIEVMRQFKVRRKSIKFIRDLTGKAARLKEVKMDNATLNAAKETPTFTLPEVKTMEAPKAEAKIEEVKTETTETAVETKEAPEKVETPKTEAKADDLTKVEWIGPKIAETLVAAGIASYAELAKADAAKISEIIADVRGNHTPDTWPKQAEMAAEGKWDELKKWQDELDGGK